MLRIVLTTNLLLSLAVLPCTLHATESAPSRPSAIVERPLDLRVPEIGTIFSLAEIDAVLSRAIDPSLEHIQVEALRLGDLPFEDNSASPPEQLARTVAWLVAPTSLFAAVEQPAPDATYSHRLPPFLLVNHHASFDQP